MQRRFTHILIVGLSIIAMLTNPLLVAAQGEPPPNPLTQTSPPNWDDALSGVPTEVEALLLEQGYKYPKGVTPEWVTVSPSFPDNPTCSAALAMGPPGAIAELLCWVVSYGAAILMGGAVVGLSITMSGSQSPQYYEVYVPRETARIWGIQSDGEMLDVLVGFNPPQDPEWYWLLSDVSNGNGELSRPWKPNSGPKAQEYFRAHLTKHGPETQAVIQTVQFEFGKNGWDWDPRRQLRCFISEMFRGTTLPEMPGWTNNVPSTRYMFTFKAGSTYPLQDYIGVIGVPGYWNNLPRVFIEVGGQGYWITAFQVRAAEGIAGILDRWKNPRTFNFRPIDCNKMPPPPGINGLQFTMGRFPKIERRHWAAAAQQ